MPALIKRMLRQRCVYWKPTGTDEFGNRTFAAPVEIRCRWEEEIVEFLDRAGNTQMSHARVFVEEVLKLLGVLWLGRLADLEDHDSPFANEGAFEIRRFDKLPTLRATQFLRTAYL